MIMINYDKHGDVLEIKFSENEVESSEYLQETGFVVDYDKAGKLISVEVLSFSKKVDDKQVIEAIAS